MSARGERAYRLLLLLLPAWFRERYAGEMLEAFRGDRDRDRFRGAIGRVGFWALAVRDVVATAIRERRDPSPLPAYGRSGGPGRWLLTEGRHAARALRRAPGFLALASVTLGLGIGSVATVFVVVDGVLLTPLDYPEPDRLVRVWERQRDNPGARMVAYGNYEDLRDRSHAFEDLAIWRFGAHTLTGAGDAVRLRSRAVSGNFARTLGIAPLHGRWITEAEARDGLPVVVLGHELWQSRFAGDPAVLGTAIRLEREPYTVVGVMPPGFDYPSSAEAWIPLQPVNDPGRARFQHTFNMVGRVAAGLDAGEAEARIEPIAARIRTEYADSSSEDFFEVRSLQDSVVGSVRSGLSTLLGACGLLLLIACVNIASLSLARSTARQREFATRSALGASRGQLAVFVLWEGLLIGLAGTGLGLGIALWAAALIRDLAATVLPRLDIVQFDATAFAAVASIGLICAVLVSAAPMMGRWKREDGTTALRQRASTAASAARGRRRLVLVELSLAVVLVVGSGLLLKSLARLGSVDSGVAEESAVVTMSIRPPAADDGAAFAAGIEEIIAAAEAAPSVLRAAVVLTEPADPSGWFYSLTIRDRPVPVAELPPIGMNIVSRGYFETMGVPLLEGRSFERGDIASAENVVVINRTAAERFWPDRNPVGALVLGDTEEDSAWARVIGVVGDIRQNLREPAHPEAFAPVEQSPVSSLVLVARVTGDPDAAAAALEPIVRGIDPDMPVTDVGTLAGRIGATLARPRLNAILMSVFAGIALLVACVGVYGVLSYAVAQRRKEFGIRMAVGADRRRVLGSVLREAAVIGAVAAGIGLLGAMALARLIEGLLFDVAPVDPFVIAGVAALTLVVSVLAGLVPALKATAVDPVAMLRED